MPTVFEGFRFKRANEGNEHLAKLRASLNIEHKPIWSLGTLNAEISNLERFIAEKSKAPSPAPAPAAKPVAKSEPAKPGPTDLVKAHFAAFGEKETQTMVRGLSTDEALDRIERSLYFSNLSVPGWSFSGVRQRFGEATPPSGARLRETAARQERIDAAFGRKAEPATKPEQKSEGKPQSGIERVRQIFERQLAAKQ